MAPVFDALSEDEDVMAAIKKATELGRALILSPAEVTLTKSEKSFLQAKIEHTLDELGVKQVRRGVKKWAT